MKRPGVSEKTAIDVDHEPDFYKISDLSPVPEKADDDSIMLHCTVKGGPKARMPVYCGGASMTDATNANVSPPPKMTSNLQEQAFLAAFQQALATANSSQQASPSCNAPLMQNPLAQVATNPFVQAPATPAALPFAVPQQQINAAAQAAASQFAAGFAAATALNSGHLRNVLGQALMTGTPQFQVQQQQPQVSTQQLQQNQ